MNARIFLLAAALVSTGLTATSCSYPHHHNRTALVGGGGLGPSYKYRATRFTSYDVSPYVPNVDYNRTTPSNYFSGRYLANNQYRVTPLVRYGTLGEPTIESDDTLHYHASNKIYDGDYTNKNLYRHSHHGYRPHGHDVTPDEAN